MTRLAQAGTAAGLAMVRAEKDVGQRHSTARPAPWCFPGAGSWPRRARCCAVSPIGLDSVCRRGMANGEITVPRVAQETVVNGYACHFARTLPESVTGPGAGGRVRLPQRTDRCCG